MFRLWHNRRLVAASCAAAAALALLLRPSPARACGCSYFGYPELIAPADGAIPANGTFLLRTSLSPASASLGEASALVEVAAHGYSLCNQLMLVRPAEPLVTGESYSLALGSKEVAFTPLPAGTPVTESPRISVSVTERPARNIEGGGCGEPTVTEWFQVDVVPPAVGELTVFAWVPYPPHRASTFNGTAVRFVDGQPLPAPPGDAWNDLPCPLCVARPPGPPNEQSCVQVRAYAIDGTLVGETSHCEPNSGKGYDAGPAPSSNGVWTDEPQGCNLVRTRGRTSASALLTALAFAARYWRAVARHASNHGTPRCSISRLPDACRSAGRRL